MKTHCPWFSLKPLPGKINADALEQFHSIVEKPLLTSLLVLILITLLVAGLSVKYYLEDFDSFWVQIIAEAHGMIFDIAIIGILLFWLNQNGEIRNGYAPTKMKLMIFVCLNQTGRHSAR